MAASRSEAEKSMRSWMRDVGVDVHFVQRRAVDLELEGAAGPVPVSVLGLSPFSTAGAIAKAVPDPSFFTVRIGQPGAPRFWGARTHTASTQRGQSTVGVQCVASDEGVLLAGGVVSVGAMHAPMTNAFFTASDGLLRRALAGDGNDKWPELHPEGAFEGWPSERSGALRKVGAAACAVAGVGVAVGAVAAGFPQAAPYAAMIGIGGALAFGVDWWRRMAAGPQRAAAALARRLRAHELVDDTSEPRVVGAVRLPVIRSAAGLRYDDNAALISVGIEASAMNRELVLRLCCCFVEWPEDTLPECRLLPASWMVLEAKAPEATLARFPPRPRLRREKSRLIWLLDEDDTSEDALWALLEDVARGVRAGIGPYR